MRGGDGTEEDGELDGVSADEREDDTALVDKWESS